MMLIVLSGLPGTGKSAVAEDLARALHFPVFAKDWLEATLLRSGLKPAPGDRPLGYAGYELLSVLAERQLGLKQSVILDSVAATVTIRNTWRDLARRYGAGWRVIECICSNEDLHRSRLGNRNRNIPGWHELDWSEVERVQTYFAPWTEPRLVLDMVHPFESNLAKAITYCAL